MMSYRVRNVLWCLVCAALFRSVAWGGAPINDRIENAIDLSGDAFELTADLRDATSDPPFDSFIGLLAGHSAWWTWTAPSDGLFEWSIPAVSTNVLVAVVREGPFGQFELVASSYTVVQFFSVISARTGSFQADVGTRYWILLDLVQSLGPIPPKFPGQIDTYPDIPAIVRFQKRLGQAPDNDSLSHAMEIDSPHSTLTVDLKLATAEPGEPMVSNGVMQRTLWWTWEATDYGTVRLQQRGDGDSPVFAVYSRGQLNALRQLVNSVSRFSVGCSTELGARSSLEWDTQPGVRYYIQADAFPHLEGHSATQFDFAFEPAPANDSPLGAVVLPSMEAAFFVTNTSSTFRPNEEAMIASGSRVNSLWYRWTAPSDGILRFGSGAIPRYEDPSFDSIDWLSLDLQATTVVSSLPCSGMHEDLQPPPPFVPLFSLYGSGRISLESDLIPMGWMQSNTNLCASRVLGGDTYFLELDTLYSTGGTNAFNMLFTANPPNDEFAHRTVLPSEALVVQGRTFGATEDTLLPFPGQFSGSGERSVWFEWRAPIGGRWALTPISRAPTSDGIQYNNDVFLVYRGSEANPANVVGEARTLPLTFDVVANEVYQIGIFSMLEPGDAFVFQLMPVIAPVAGIRFFNSLPTQSYAELTISRNAGLRFTIESSTDLLSWKELAEDFQPEPHSVPVQVDWKVPVMFFRTVLMEP